MTEVAQQEPKRRGRPPKAKDSTEQTEGTFGVKVFMANDTIDTTLRLPISPEMRTFIVGATEIKIVCKVKDAGDVTKAALTENALWLKEYV